jgi:phage terminase large subunit-like protein
VRNACRRHLDDLKHGPSRGLKWDLPAALRAINFCPDVLRLAQGKFEGLPFVPEPSQAFILGSIFGWKRADGFRRFRRVYIEQAKGNGKSPTAGAIGMYCLVADGEPQAEVYAGASMKSQAMVIFRSVVMMWKQSPALSSRLTPSGGNPVWNLADLKTGSFFRPISTEEAHSGPMPSCALLDEIHEHRDGSMVEMMERGFKSRRQPLLIMITNAGSDRNSVCWQEHLHGVRVAAGTMTVDDEATYVGEPIDDSSFSYVCALDKGEDPLEDESCWIKANPLIDVTMPSAELRRAFAQAKAIPGKLNNVLRLHGCVWTDSDSAWMSRQALEACLDDFDPAELSGEAVSCGIDLSGSQDLTALAFVSRTGMVERPNADGTGVVMMPTFDAWVEAWTPGDTIRERALRDQAPYETWVEQGWLNAPPGKQVRLDFVAARLAGAAAEYKIEAVAYDRYAYRKMEDELDALGVSVMQIEHPQGGKRRAAVPDDILEKARRDGSDPPLGLWMPGSLGMLETLILERRIRIRRSPVIISAMMSATTEEDPFGNRWFSKRKATNRIDAAVALAMAIGCATAAFVDKPRKRSFWDYDEAELVV